MIKDKSLSKEVVKELDSLSASGTVSATSNGKNAFFTQTGLALAVYCKSQEHQQDVIFLSMMTSPEKKETLSMKKAVMLAKLRAETRCFEETGSTSLSTSIHSSVLIRDNTNTTISSTNKTQQPSCKMSFN
jgi:hypothetical protein